MKYITKIYGIISGLQVIQNGTAKVYRNRDLCKRRFPLTIEVRPLNQNSFGRNAALSVLLSGFAFGFMAMFLNLPIWESGSNYGVHSLFTELAGSLARGLMFLCLGLYLGGGFIWLRSGEERLFLPHLLPAGGALGCCVGGLVGGVLQLLRELAGPGISDSSFSLRTGSTGMALVFLGCTGGVFLTLHLQFSKSPSFLSRLIQLLAGLALFSALPFLTFHSSDFPTYGTIVARDVWAEKNLGPHYQGAKHAVLSSKKIRDGIGDITAIGPANGLPNSVFYGPGESMGQFSLDVIGKMGTGVAHLELLIPNHAEKTASANVQLISFSWDSRGILIPLRPDGSLDEEKIKFDQGKKKTEELQAALSRLYQERKYEAVVKTYLEELEKSKSISHNQEMAEWLAASHENLKNASQAAYFYAVAAFHEENSDQRKKGFLEKALALDPQNSLAMKILREIQVKQPEGK